MSDLHQPNGAFVTADRRAAGLLALMGVLA
jgi:hypothetical protein